MTGEGAGGREGEVGKARRGRTGNGEEKGKGAKGREISPPRSFLKVGAYGVEYRICHALNYHRPSDEIVPCSRNRNRPATTFVTV